jgi:hypothetical protein
MFTDADDTLNEIIPLLYLSLRYQYNHFLEDYKRENQLQEELEDPFLMEILKLDDFITYDEECEILNP